MQVRFTGKRPLSAKEPGKPPCERPHDGVPGAGIRSPHLPGPATGRSIIQHHIREGAVSASKRIKWVYDGRHISVLGATRMAPTHAASPRPLTRRRLLGARLSAPGLLACSDPGPHTRLRCGRPRPGCLAHLAADGGRRAATTGATPPSGEHAELVELQGQTHRRDAGDHRPWDDPTVVLPWTNLALDLIRVHTPNPVRAARALALLHVALFDTLVATEDARAAYPRPGPATDKAIVPLGQRGPEVVILPLGPGRRGGGRLDGACLSLPQGVGRGVCRARGRGGHESAPGRDAPSAVISTPGKRSGAPSASARWPVAKRTDRTRPGMARAG